MRDCVITFLHELLATADDSGIGYFVGEDLKYTDALTKHVFSIMTRIQKTDQVFSSDLMKNNMRRSYRAINKLLFNWTDKKSYYT